RDAPSPGTTIRRASSKSVWQGLLVGGGPAPHADVAQFAAQPDKDDVSPRVVRAETAFRCPNEHVGHPRFKWPAGVHVVKLRRDRRPLPVEGDDGVGCFK